jgi:hypothetical protein
MRGTILRVFLSVSLLALGTAAVAPPPVAASSGNYYSTGRIWQCVSVSGIPYPVCAWAQYDAYALITLHQTDHGSWYTVDYVRASSLIVGGQNLRNIGALGSFAAGVSIYGNDGSNFGFFRMTSYVATACSSADLCVTYSATPNVIIHTTSNPPGYGIYTEGWACAYNCIPYTNGFQRSIRMNL